jgi:hypothetical protein
MKPCSLVEVSRVFEECTDCWHLQCWKVNRESTKQTTCKEESNLFPAYCLLGFLCNSEVRGSMFLRNIGTSTEVHYRMSDLRRYRLRWLVYSWSFHMEHRASVKRFVSLQFLNLRHSIGLLGQVISPSQGRYLTQTQNKHRHPCLVWDSNPRSQRSSERRQFMP